MNTNEHELEILDCLAEAVIGAAYEVSNDLGAGFLEKVYERALTRELALRGLHARQQVHYSVLYKGRSVGEYVGDLVVDDRLLVELKCVDRFIGEHTAQCINYLRVSGLKLGLMFNFQRPKVEWKRIVL
jgi:GxxExxY protein